MGIMGNKFKRHYNIVIIGGGASGLAAAIACGKNSRPDSRILLIEKQDRVGRKLLATGNGRCNLTNDRIDPDCYRSEDISEAARILSGFGTKDSRQLFAEAGLLIKSQAGLCYPYSEQASAVRRVLETAVLSCENVDLLTGTRVLALSSREGLFSSSFFEIRIRKDGKDPEILKADRVIVCTGGYAGPDFGCSGDGYEFAKQLGHSLIKPLPSLTALVSGAPFLKKLNGLRTQAGVSLLTDGEFLHSDRGQVQWTDYGVSGIVIFQLSRYAAIALEEGKNVALSIDFMPDYEDGGIIDLLGSFIRRKMIIRRKSVKDQGDRMRTAIKRDNNKVEDLLAGIFPEKLIPILLKEAGIKPEEPCARLKSSHLTDLCRVIKHFPLKIKGIKGYDKAQVTRGGVPLSELDDHLESGIHPGLYFAGELVDVDGICGGYNLHWAWASGTTAGKAAAREAFFALDGKEES